MLIKDYNLSKEELTRYSRNIFLKEIGKEGQLKLKKSSVLVIGAGGLGSPLLYYLASIGVGNIIFIEYDKVDLTNLQRQILYKTEDIGKEKAFVAKHTLKKLNPEINIQEINEKLTPHNAFEIIKNIDLVIDGSDNFPTRFLVNDVCFFNHIPLISGGVLQFYGMIMGIIPGKTPCYRCLFERPPEDVENCSTVGVLGAMVGVIGSYMAVESIKFLLNIQPNIMGKLIRIDALTMEFRITDLPRNDSCLICSSEPLIKKFNPKLSDYYEVCNSLPSFLKE
ncbi:MAG: thiazole biosynthesis adenylyltransferase ThiF [Leptospiraceae bacterium]|nr:MAG: thiazole biosynthesis adenylyltransferase ThiF [Leptospiraceae bacterium]